MLKVFEAFAGIGTQTMALKKQGIEHEVTAISEVDEYALLSYHAIHTADTEVKEANEAEMQRYMEKKNIPLDPKGKRKILKNKKLKDLYVASVASNNLGDISKITDDEIPRIDLFTYSFPCQDISLAGQQQGLEKGSGTRSSLLWECERIIETVKPKYLLMENVKALVNKNNKPQFDIWLEYLEELGYKNFWQVLNAKDYGIPQNRERVFVVSILDENADYKFPTKIPLTLKLKDILEDNVDDSYYLSQEQVDRITFSTYNTGRTRIQEKDYSDTLCARDFKDPKCVVVGGVGKKNFGKQYRQGNRVYDSEGVAACLHASPVGGAGGQSSLYKVNQIGQYNTTTRKNSSRFRVYDDKGLSPSLTTMGGGNLEPHIPIKNATKKGYIEAKDGDGIDLAFPESKTRRGRVQKEISQTLDTGEAKGVLIGASRGRNPKNPSDRTAGVKTEQRLEINKNSTSNTLTSVQKDNLVVEPIGTLAAHNSNNFGSGYMDGISKTLKAEKHDISVVYSDYRIRKLTPLECWRLMGILDEDFYKAQKVNSNSQLYKQAGNAIVVDVLEGIFKQLFNPDKNNLEGQQTKNGTFVKDEDLSD